MNKFLKCHKVTCKTFYVAIGKIIIFFDYFRYNFNLEYKTFTPLVDPSQNEKEPDLDESEEGGSTSGMGIGIVIGIILIVLLVLGSIAGVIW